ncbi:MAG TPA: glycosyltransferase [Terracidiphilus sp.]|nr:glycosyltransferase [Terracidiphilus sp.]
MRVLLLHNRYQVRGGEDTVVDMEREMLCGAGVTVDLLEVSNDQITGAAAKIGTAVQVPYSFASRRLTAARIRAFQPDVVHVHNFFPALSPSIYDACRAARVPVVQTLHNYRLVCANALLFRNGKICTECLDRALPLPAIRHNCYRDSKAGSAAVAAMIALHRARRTWASRVQRFIVLTQFAHDLFTRHAQIPAEKICIKPNAAPDPGRGSGAGGYALYVGRLSQEKGIEPLLAAAVHGQGLGMPLLVAGDGPLLSKVQALCAPGKLEYAGLQDAAGVRRLMLEARVLLLPSLWYEGLPMVVPEAFGAGLPIVASRIGALETLIEDGANGLLAEPGNPAALAAAVRRVAAGGDFEQDLRGCARATYEAQYQPEANLRLLLQIYRQATESLQGH